MLVVLDTNHFTELALGSELGRRLSERIEERGADPFSCIVAAEESLQGWIAFVRRHRPGTEQVDGYARLHSCLQALFGQERFHYLAGSLPARSTGTCR